LSLVCFHFGILQILPDTLCKSLSHDEINLDSKVLSLSYNSGSRQENWSLSCVSHNETQRQNPHYDAVIMTAPLCNVKEMKVMKGGQPFQLNFLPEVIVSFTTQKFMFESSRPTSRCGPVLLQILIMNLNVTSKNYLA
jgi:hypothetical protein